MEGFKRDPEWILLLLFHSPSSNANSISLSLICTLDVCVMFHVVKLRSLTTGGQLSPKEESCFHFPPKQKHVLAISLIQAFPAAANTVFFFSTVATRMSQNSEPYPDGQHPVFY